MNIGMTGTRLGMTKLQKETFSSLIKSMGVEVFRHGGCEGADIEAAQLVRECGESISIICHPGPHSNTCHVDDIRVCRKSYLARNRDIVDLSELLIACPYDATERGGTWYTINYARKVGKGGWIIWSDGSKEPLNEEEGSSL
jgi:hypothetical protein